MEMELNVRLIGLGVQYVHFNATIERGEVREMVKVATLSTLENLREEMAAAARSAEQAALEEALRWLSRPRQGVLTTGETAERLGISIPTVKRWIERGTLDGGPVGGRWLVSEESVEHHVRLRKLLKAMDEEGNPTDEEIQEMYSRSRRSSTS